MDKQEVAKNVYEDVGTSVRGRLAYVVPTVFYQLGEHGRRAAYVRLGIGAGLGAAKYDGSIILDYPANTTPIAISNGDYGLKFAASLMLEARYRNWGPHVYRSGPLLRGRAIPVRSDRPGQLRQLHLVFLTGNIFANILGSQISGR
jgi:hypothetical protein